MKKIIYTLGKQLYSKIKTAFHDSLQSNSSESDSHTSKILILISVFLGAFFLTLIFILMPFYSFYCSIPGTKCDTKIQQKMLVVDMDTIKEYAERVHNYRAKVNSEVDNPGENFARFEVIEKKPGIKDNKEIIQNTEMNPSQYPIASPKEWLTGDVEGLVPGFANRLAGLAASRGQKIHITSGYRSIEEQRVLWENSDKTGKWVAAPYKSRHNYGLAIDTSSFPKYMSNAELAKFGLYKPMPYEDWHIEPVETKGKKAEELANVIIDGTGATVSTGNLISEAYIHLMAFKQLDESKLPHYSEKYLNEQAKKKTNLGKTWILARAIKERVEKGNYKNDVEKMAKENEWTNDHYLRYARWEIQKCFYLGDQTSDGFIEKIFGGPTPCRDAKQITGQEIVPAQYQGVVGKTEKTTECIASNESGKCTKTRTIESVKYTDIEDLLKLYLKVSLVDEKEHDKYYEELKKIIDYLYKETFGSDGLFFDNVLPPYIAPVESGTYQLSKRFGDKVENNEILGVRLSTSGTNTPVYASSSGQVVAVFDHPLYGKTILISHQDGNFTQYSYLKETLVRLNQVVEQGQLIGSFSSSHDLEFQVCKEKVGQQVALICGKHTDPELDPANIDFETKEDKTKVAKRSKDYTEWKKQASKGEKIIMPGFELDYGLGFNGIISEKYETGFRGAGFCSDGGVKGWDVYGGDSCGSWQFSSKIGVIYSFTQWTKERFPQYYRKLSIDTPKKGQGIISSTHRNIWATLGKDPNFKKAQFLYAAEMYYKLPASMIKKATGIDITTRHRAVKEMTFSMCIHAGAGGCTSLYKSAGVNANSSDREIIEKVMAAKDRKYPQFKSRHQREKQDLLRILEGKNISRN